MVHLKISPWKRRFLLESIVFGFHVKLQGCRSSGKKNTLLLKSKHVLQTEIIRSSFFSQWMLWNETKVANFFETLEDYKVGPPKRSGSKLTPVMFFYKAVGGILCYNPIEITGIAGCPPCTQCWPQTWGYRVSQSPGGPTSINLSWNEAGPPVVGLDIPNPGIKECGAKGKIRQVPISTCFCWYLLYMEYVLCMYMEILRLDFFRYCVTYFYIYM